MMAISFEVKVCTYEYRDRPEQFDLSQLWCNLPFFGLCVNGCVGYAVKTW